MCGIVGAIAEQNVVPILVDGIKRLEYRGYDSSGLAIFKQNTDTIQCLRTTGKVSVLEKTLKQHAIAGHAGIAHTRWATHGKPSQTNAHPQCSHNKIALVHNGIIENDQILRQELQALSYTFHSETDTEVICHLIHYYLQHSKNPLDTIQKTLSRLKGSYALGIAMSAFPNHLFAARCDSPLVLGLGKNAHFIASDPLALLPLTHRFIHLEDGQIAQLSSTDIYIENNKRESIQYKVHESKTDMPTSTQGTYRHFMLKEIFEQPEAINNTLAGHLTSHKNTINRLGSFAESLLKSVKRLRIVACGSSYHAALLGCHWFESLTQLPCQAEIASENRYRKTVIDFDTLFVALSQSGETADTLAALRQAKTQGYSATLSICNVHESALVRESDLSLITQAGVEVGVAATKTFTTQLTALLWLAITLRQHHAPTDPQVPLAWQALKSLPQHIKKILTRNEPIITVAQKLHHKKHALFLGRGEYYPIALEGALKLKEISYIHAEAHPAGELKHGPLALVDQEMPVIVIAPNNSLIEKLISNIQEIQARGAELYVLGEKKTLWPNKQALHLIEMPDAPALIMPILYTVPLQLLAYYTALQKGTNIDQPRNLAKSVTVE